VWWQSIASGDGMPRWCSGLWKFLAIRAEGQTAIALERERNRATAEALRMLPGGCELLEYERDGRLRVIRYPGQPEAADTQEFPPGEIRG
jgi:hypothetical protein